MCHTKAPRPPHCTGQTQPVKATLLRRAAAIFWHLRSWAQEAKWVIDSVHAFTIIFFNLVWTRGPLYICEDAEQAVGCFQKAVKVAKKCIAEKSIAKSSLCISFNLPTKECVADELKEMFEQYLSDCNAIILDNQGITCDAILNDYFSGTAPFENREKKKHEFPDAIMIAKLKKEFPEGKILWVISDDEGFKQALKGNAQFRCLSRLQELYNLRQYRTEKSAKYRRV